MTNAQELRKKRTKAGLTAALVANRATIHPSRLCRIERGYAVASEDELRRIARAIDELAHAQSEIQAVAERFGWPFSTN